MCIWTIKCQTRSAFHFLSMNLDVISIIVYSFTSNNMLRFNILHRDGIHTYIFFNITFKHGLSKTIDGK